MEFSICKSRYNRENDSYEEEELDLPHTGLRWEAEALMAIEGEPDCYVRSELSPEERKLAELVPTASRMLEALRARGPEEISVFDNV